MKGDYWFLIALVALMIGFALFAEGRALIRSRKRDRQIIEAIAAHAAGLSFAALSRRTGLDHHELHTHLATLGARGIIVRERVRLAAVSDCWRYTLRHGAQRTPRWAAPTVDQMPVQRRHGS